MSTTDIDLESMDRKELETLISDARKALETLEARKKLEAKRAAEDTLKAYGFSLNDIVDDKTAPGKKATRGAPKYAHPEDPTLTWTGRGRKPKWIVEALEAGKSIDDFAI